MTDISVEIKKNVNNIDVSVEKKGGTSNYNELENKPSINGVELVGNKTTADLDIEIDTSNLVTKDELENKGYLTEHQDISHLATKEDVNRLINEFGNILDEINGEII
jgi:hypothetical protein